MSTKSLPCPARNRAPRSCLRSCRNGSSIDRRRAPPPIRPPWSTHDARREMPRRVAELPQTLLLRDRCRAKRRHRRARPARAIDPETKIEQALGVDDDGALVGQHRAAHAAARAERHELKTQPLRERDELTDLFPTLRPHYGARAIFRHLSALNSRPSRMGPEIARGRRARSEAFCADVLAKSGRRYGAGLTRDSTKGFRNARARGGVYVVRGVAASSGRYSGLYLGSCAALFVLAISACGGSTAAARAPPASAQQRSKPERTEEPAEDDALRRRRERAAPRAACDDGTCSPCGNGMCPTPVGTVTNRPAAALPAVGFPAWRGKKIELWLRDERAGIRLQVHRASRWPARDFVK